MTAARPVRARAASAMGLASAMGKTGAAALGSALLAAAATKIIAVWLGPWWVGFLGTLTQTRQTALVAATANGQTALVQGLGALEGREKKEFFRTSLAVIGVATMLVAGGMILAREQVAAWAGLPRDSGEWIAWLALAVILGSAGVVLTALLTALGEIGRLAWMQIAGPAAMAILAVPAVMIGSRGALTGMVAIAGGLSLGAACWCLRGYWKRTGSWIRESGFRWNAARRFASISGAMAATGLLASGGLMAIRARIIHKAGLSVAGNFDAAWAISMNQVTLVLASMQTYYLPELARARSDFERREQVTVVMRTAIGVSAAIISGIALLKPLVISIFYSEKFGGAADLLRWTLIGDYLKVTSWVLAIPMIAAADMRAFVVADTIAQAVFLASSWALGSVCGPAEGAALGFMACYAVNVMVCYGYARRRMGWSFGSTGFLWAGGLMAVLLADFVGR